MFRPYSFPTLPLALLLMLSVYCVNAMAVTPGLNWKDSYSVNGQCYCDTTYDHETADIVVNTPAGNRTVKQICEKIGPGPGAGNNPIYNDVQCGNGPPNNAIDEVLCPGRVDMGSAGCSVIGPTWNLENYFPAPAPPEPEETAETTTESEPSNTTVQPEPEESTTEPEPTTIPDTSNNEEEGSLTPPEGLIFNAADFSSKDDRWLVIDSGTNLDASGPDPDGAHFDSATNGRYLELLPDVKVLDGDEATSSSVWAEAGHGPQVHFDVNIETAGTYAVFVRAFSTGSYDSRLHVGFDGLWPSSGRPIIGCGKRGVWVWTFCASSMPPTITIPTSGVHSIQFAAFDDGFEFDQFVLQWMNDGGVSTTDAQAFSQQQPTGGTGVNTDATNEPELGQAVLVGGGAMAFGNKPLYAGFIVLLLGLALLRHNRI